MTKYYAFIIDLSKVKSEAADQLTQIQSRELERPGISSHTDPIPSMLAGTLADIINKNNQTATHNTEELSDKAATIQKQSNYDLQRYKNITLIIDGKKIVLENCLAEIMKSKNLEKEQLTMDHLVDYLQETKNVAISEEQRHFLRTQWNQGNTTGISGLLAATAFTDHMGKPSTEMDITKQESTFIFKKGKLHSVQYHSSAKEIQTDNPRSGKFSTIVDLKSMIGEASKTPDPLTDQDWIPRKSPPTILHYKSRNGLEADISKQIATEINLKGSRSISKSVSRKFSRLKESLSRKLPSLPTISWPKFSLSRKKENDSTKCL